MYVTIVVLNIQNCISRDVTVTGLSTVTTGVLCFEIGLWVLFGNGFLTLQDTSSGLPPVD